MLLHTNAAARLATSDQPHRFDHNNHSANGYSTITANGYSTPITVPESRTVVAVLVGEIEAVGVSGP